MSLIMGLDPSFTATGIVLLDNGEVAKQLVISTPATDPIYKRVKTIQATIRAQCDEMPDLFVIEGISFASKGQGALQQGYLQYSIREYILYVLNQRFIDVAPTQLKKFATGKGQCDKNLILKEVYKRWGYDTDNDNLADAYVLAQVGRAYMGDTEGLTAFQQEVIASLKGDKPAKKTRKKVEK